MLERDGEVGLVHVHGPGANERVNPLLQSRPGDGLGLLQEWRDVYEEPEIRRALDCPVEQFHEGQFGLPGASVQGKDGEPPALEVAPPLPFTRLVAEADGFIRHQVRQ